MGYFKWNYSTDWLSLPTPQSSIFQRNVRLFRKTNLPTPWPSVFQKNIKLPEQSIGDILLIKNAGAYGKVMSSSYNTRILPSEILVNKEMFAIIYSSDKIEKYIDQDIVPSWL